jgi:hypothetical protein
MNSNERKREKKIQKRFLLNILHTASQGTSLNSSSSSTTGGPGSGDIWEDHELARLFLLLTETMAMTNKKKIKLLSKIPSLSSSEFLACLQDSGLTIPTKDLLGLIQSKAKNFNEMIQILQNNLEQNVIDLQDENSMQFVQFVCSPLLPLLPYLDNFLTLSVLTSLSSSPLPPFLFLLFLFFLFLSLL